MADEEWTTVRRRRSSIPGQAKALNKRLAIPVVPLAFEALEVEGNALQDAEREREAEKKRKRKENKAKLAAEQRSMQTHATAAEGKAAAAGAPATKAGERAASSAASKGLADSLWEWLSLLLCASLLQALFAKIKALLGLEAKKKKKAKPQQAAAAAGAAAAAKDEKKQDQAAAAAASTKSAGGKGEVASSSGAQSQDAKPKQAAAAAAPATPVKSTPAQPTPASSSKAGQGAAAAAAAATAAAPTGQGAASAAKAHGTPGLPEPQASAQPKAAPGSQASPAPAAKAKKPPAPCDGDWARGQFLAAQVPSAHPDVIAAVALAGDVALSSGYDGAIKVWSWQPKCGLEHTRNLTGHSGRVEALALEAATATRAASSGRDSTLKVWDLSRDSSSAVASYYVYDSVRCMALDWATSTAALGCASGAVALWDVERGRKLQVLKGHRDEVCSLLLEADGRLISGSKDAEVFVWDVRSSPATQTAVLSGLRGRACSLSTRDHLLYVGDCSSTLKVYDLRSGSEEPSACIPNTPAFAGDVCPVAALHQDAAGRVLLSSSIGWWTGNKQALEEAPEDEEHPVSCLNVHACHPLTSASSATALPASGYEYLYTLRLCPGIATCLAVSNGAGPCAGLAANSTRMLVGTSGGTLVGLSLLRGGRGREEAGVTLEEGLPLGVEELSDDESDEDEDE